MEDVIIWIFWAVVIGISVVNASLKAKKKREEAEKTIRRRVQQYESNPFPMPEPEPERLSPKSLGQILEELASQQTQRWEPTPEPEFVEGRDDTVNPGEIVYQEGRGTQVETVYAEGGRVTKDTSGQDGNKLPSKGHAKATAKENNVQPKDTQDTQDGENGLIKDILGGKFDLRRAIVESEIITPKYF